MGSGEHCPLAFRPANAFGGSRNLVVTRFLGRVGGCVRDSQNMGILSHPGGRHALLTARHAPSLAGTGRNPRVQRQGRAQGGLQAVLTTSMGTSWVPPSTPPWLHPSPFSRWLPARQTPRGTVSADEASRPLETPSTRCSGRPLGRPDYADGVDPYLGQLAGRTWGGSLPRPACWPYTIREGPSGL